MSGRRLVAAMSISRRRFLGGALAVASRLRSAPLRARAAERTALGFPDAAREWRGESSVAAAQRDASRFRTLAGPYASPVPTRPSSRQTTIAAFTARFPQLSRHLIFEYYAWYGASPYRHWDESDRQPPFDVASNYMPSLGPYDSQSTAVLEQHARWIADVGVGAINVSWWGPGSRSDLAVPRLMDVMGAHDIRVTFHLEPYTNDRAGVYVRDILYLLDQYGAKRGWDAFLLLDHADGTRGPVLKSFRTVLPAQMTDCHGVVHQVPDYTPDADWRRATDRLRAILLPEFSRVVLLADSLDVARTRTSGFDGIAIFDNFVRPGTWSRHAAAAQAHGLIHAFNVNPGYDGIERRNVPPDSCYRPPRFEPVGQAVTWSDAASREAAILRSLDRIDESLDTTLRLQADPSSTNARRGVFLLYLNSFNEWHEGHQFEPMRNARDLTPSERRFGYHNPSQGDVRLRHLQQELRPLVGDTSLRRRSVRIGGPQ